MIFNSHARPVEIIFDEEQTVIGNNIFTQNKCGIVVVMGDDNIVTRDNCGVVVVMGDDNIVTKN
jgi:parallel beta-helix repeat protein